MLQAGARICKSLGEEFLPYLGIVMPPLLASAQLRPDVRVSDAGSDGDDADDDADDDVRAVVLTQNPLRACVSDAGSDGDDADDDADDDVRAVFISKAPLHARHPPLAPLPCNWACGPGCARLAAFTWSLSSSRQCSDQAEQEPMFYLCLCHTALPQSASSCQSQVHSQPGCPTCMQRSSCSPGLMPAGCAGMQVETIYLGDRKLSVRTSVLEEKATACNMLCCYADELKDGFYPYVEQARPPLHSLLLACVPAPWHSCHPSGLPSHGSGDNPEMSGCPGSHV